jgi:hypothetical protein
MSGDYELFYKESFSDVGKLAALPPWKSFVSAYNLTNRVQSVFHNASAARKYWLVHSEYGFSADQLPAGDNVFDPRDKLSEDEFVIRFFDEHPEALDESLCFDMSGLMRPHIAFLLQYLRSRSVRSVDVLYAEPAQYTKHEHTTFAHGDIEVVRPIAGYAGSHEPSLRGEKDLLIIGSGYEWNLTINVATAKNNTNKIEVLGFPPLQADFYQENRLNAQVAAEALRPVLAGPLFAPANDPFVTASVVSDAVRTHGARSSNVYLCPVASKPQALGFALYCLFEGAGKPLSLVYPFAPRYRPDTATGLARVWKYTVELV